MSVLAIDVSANRRDGGDGRHGSGLRGHVVFELEHHVARFGLLLWWTGFVFVVVHSWCPAERPLLVFGLFLLVAILFFLNFFLCVLFFESGFLFDPVLFLDLVLPFSLTSKLLFLAFFIKSGKSSTKVCKFL